MWAGTVGVTEDEFFARNTTTGSTLRRIVRGRDAVS